MRKLSENQLAVLTAMARGTWQAEAETIGAMHGVWLRRHQAAAVLTLLEAKGLVRRERRSGKTYWEATPKGRLLVREM